jgi:hypothetical protein
VRLCAGALAERGQNGLGACGEDLGSQAVPLSGHHRAPLVGRSLSQTRYWASSDLEADPAGLLTHIAARWEIEIFFEDGKEELGLDQYQVMSASALLRFWTLAMLVYVFLEEEQQRLCVLWQRPVSIGEARREIQRRHRRRLLA